MSDTHVVAAGTTFFGRDSGRYLSDALEALATLRPMPDFVVVTGDLVNYGRTGEYEQFAAIMARSGFAYFVIPGNHDERDVMRVILPPATYGAAREGRVRYAVDEFAVRLVGIDLNCPRPWPGASFDNATMEWLDATLSSDSRPTLLAVHQPAFATGLWYFDYGGFLGATRFRALVDRHPHVRAVISGHVHCARTARWRYALASTAPSPSPQTIPLAFMQGRIVGLARERPGFVLHDLDGTSYERSEYRRGDDGAYGPVTGP